MHWLVFGDDWGRHPSTTQHLIRNLPVEDQVTWVDSNGMRAPRISIGDLARVRSRFRSPEATGLHAHLRPRVLPWHTSTLARALNRWRLRGLPDADVTLITNPVASLYLRNVKLLVYLRLDDWPNFRGVDPAFIAAAEPSLLREADLVVAPNARLLEGVTAPTLLLPQGVDLEHFAQVPLDPPQSKVVGFWGGLSAWLDQELIVQMARAHPDWTFELIGRREVELRLDAPNIHVRGPVPYADLPAVTAHWRGAWLPYVVGDATRGMSPLKLREYLAAGFPTASTALPEARALPVTLIDAAGRWLGALEQDTRSERAARRESVAGDTWTSRATTLRQTIQRKARRC